MKVLSFGSLNIDTSLSVAEFASAGKTVAASAIDRSFGGKGLNQSVALARAGISVFHAGKIGGDGAPLRDYLARCGVDVSLVGLSDKPTGSAMIQVDDSGENCIVVYGGANADVDVSYIDAVLENFGEGDFVVLQNEISNVGYIARRARQKGMTVALNPSPAEGLCVDMQNVDFLILNETEAYTLFGARTPDELKTSVCGAYPKIKTVFTLGESGSCYISEDVMEFAAAENVAAVDTTGAGDTYTGYFLAETLRGKTPKQAMTVASVAAAIAVTRKGAASSVPNKAEVETYLNNKCKNSNI